MSFLEKIPTYIKDLESEITDFQGKQVDINWGHACDCEYCDRDGDNADPNADELNETINTEIRQRKRMIQRLERYKEMMA